MDVVAHHLEKQIIPHWLRNQRAARRLPINPLAHAIETKSCGKRFASMCKRGRAISTTVCRAATLSYSSPNASSQAAAAADATTDMTVDLATAIGAKCKVEQTFLMAWVRHPWQRCWQEYHELIQRKGGSALNGKMPSAFTTNNGATIPTYAEFARDLCAGSRCVRLRVCA